MSSSYHSIHDEILGLGATLRFKRLTIGDWDMDADATSYNRGWLIMWHEA